MTEELTAAINAVRIGKYSFCKFVSPNDAGTTGAHQAGLYIPKKAVSLIFDTPGIKGTNREEIAKIDWFDGTVAPDCRLKYYGVGTRGEYRITRLNKSLEEGSLVILVKMEQLTYLGFNLKSKEEQDAFLERFNLTAKDTNALIDPNKIPMADTDMEAELPKNDQELPESNNYDVRELNFRPKAHILTLLGEELIRDPVMAIYELVKNSYDADAKDVSVSFNNITDINNSEIVIIDSGLGMTEEILENVWLEPGTAHRKPIGEDGRRQIIRSPIFHRVPMGEKGVGRFAVHKLGRIIKLKSRPATCIFDDAGKFLQKKLLDYEIHLEIDWTKFTQSKYLSDVNITWKKNFDVDSFYFRKDSGTKIEITGLKETWTRGMARQLKRQTISMVSPKNDPGKFSISLDFNNNWLDRFPDINEIIAQAPYKLTAIIDRDYNFSFEYEFHLENNSEIGSRTIRGDKAFDRNVRVEMRPVFREFYINGGVESDKVDDIANSKIEKPIPFGEMLIELYSYDLDSESLRDFTYTPDVLKKTLRDQHGIKVFKNDLRVYDYGEAGNDWLGLDIKRVNNKSWFSNNQNIGFIYLDSETSGSLIEKTNREGFINNDSFDYFKIVIEFILNEFRVERLKDRTKWRNLHRKASPKNTFQDRYQSFVNLINDADIQDPDKKQKLLEEAAGIEEDYEKTKETLLLPAGIGMTASVALHEIEKLVPRMDETVNTVPLNEQRIKNQVIELDGYVQGILSVLKSAGSKPVDVKEAIDQALVNYKLKFKLREITPIVEIEEGVETVICDRRFLITVLMNLTENSVWWLDSVNRSDKTILYRAIRRNGIVSIIVADNGPGFKDTPEEIVTPFFSRREGGIGIGMYLVDTIMMKYGKLKIYKENLLADIDQKYTGAVVELVFNKN
ncbi:MAG TPA: EcoRII N-terminal effector-binding domain-containing protein [Cytophagales bacterium]|nr:EcoRII N-terminal effector-binding domain-containing protein [Cytophagales bacterium]